MNHFPNSKYGKYALKGRILNGFSLSKSAKLRQLLKVQVLGDKRPSHFLQELKNLAGGQVTDDIIKMLFIEQLPENYRTILAIIDESDLDKLAIVTDKIADFIPSNSALALVSGKTENVTSNTSVQTAPVSNTPNNSVRTTSPGHEYIAP